MRADQLPPGDRAKGYTLSGKRGRQALTPEELREISQEVRQRRGL